MTFLFPVTIPETPTYRLNKFTSKVIYLSRTIDYVIGYQINWDMVRNVERACPNVEYLSDEYFDILRSTLPIFEFYCYQTDMMVNLDYCFSSCRFKFKKSCDEYLRGLICCRPCQARYSCSNRDNCEARRSTLMYMSLYFSELMRRPSIVLKMRKGISFKKNYLGQGAQIYFNVGSLPDSKNRRKNSNPSILIGRKMLQKRRREAKCYRNKRRKGNNK